MIDFQYSSQYINVHVIINKVNKNLNEEEIKANQSRNKSFSWPKKTAELKKNKANNGLSHYNYIS